MTIELLVIKLQELEKLAEIVFSDHSTAGSESDFE